MTDEDEINAMKQISAALGPLDDLARGRVLYWAMSRYRTKASGADGASHAGANSQRDATRFDTFAELFAAADPTTEREKALLAAYWEQVCRAQASLASQTLNDLLKDLGHGVGNITDALSALKDERPALVLQLKKSGTSKQARKTYKLTVEGIRRVQSMIDASAEAA
jgi:hypothetical protein